MPRLTLSKNSRGVAVPIRILIPQVCCIRNNVITAKTMRRQTRRCRVQRNIIFIKKNDVLNKSGSGLLFSSFSLGWPGSVWGRAGRPGSFQD